MKRVLITGANGGVAGMLVPGLTEYDLRLTDRTATQPSQDVVLGDLTEPGFVHELVSELSETDAVVHLAANPDPSEPWERLRSPNADAVVNLLEAGVPRLVMASSAHVMGQYVVRGGTGIDPALPPAPCCAYGAAKAFAEAYGRTVAYRERTPVVALRLGATRPTPPATSALDGWLGPQDLQQLVVRALEANLDELPAPFTVCHGISANTRSPWSLRNDIGYAPRLDAEEYADQVPVDDGWGLCRAG